MTRKKSKGEDVSLTTDTAAAAASWAASRAAESKVERDTPAVPTQEEMISAVGYERHVRPAAEKARKLRLEYEDLQEATDIARKEERVGEKRWKAAATEHERVSLEAEEEENRPLFGRLGQTGGEEVADAVCQRGAIRLCNIMAGESSAAGVPVVDTSAVAPTGVDDQVPLQAALDALPVTGVDDQVPQAAWRLKKLHTVLRNYRHAKLLAAAGTTTVAQLADLMDEYGSTWNRGLKGIGGVARQEIEEDMEGATEDTAAEEVPS